MGGYLIHFLFYTLAMLGIFFLAFIVLQKSLSIKGHNCKNQFLSIESSLCIEPRKNIYVIKAGEERFLISTAPEGSTFLTKLGENNIKTEEKTYSSRINQTIPAPILSFAKSAAKKLTF